MAIKLSGSIKRRGLCIFELTGVLYKISTLVRYYKNTYESEGQWETRQAIMYDDAPEWEQVHSLN